MFERLTEKGCKFLTPANASKNELLDEIKRHQKYYDRLAAYEDSELSPEEVQELAKAEAEGRLVVLPCKVGDTIYRPEALQYSWDIVSATIYPDEIVFTDDSDNIIKETDIGKTVFLTREEAEKALGVKNCNTSF